MIRDILQQYRDESAFNRDLGDRFERLMRAYLKLDPQYLALFEDVWLWKDWPQREALGYKLPDTGIDLVAKLRDEDGYCAIQCKFYDSPIPLGDLGNFFTLSGKGGFTQRLIVATAPLSKHAADALEGQTIRNRSLIGVLCPPAPTRNNPSHIHQGGAGSDQGDSDQQQVAAA